MRNKRPILLVDDDAVDVMTARRALKEAGVSNRVDTAENGEAALRHLAANEQALPCLILLDLNMPKMNGIEFLTAVKKDERFRMIPVVVLTTSKGDQERLACFRWGAAGYMIKCVEFNEFVELVKTINSYWSNSESPF